MFLDVLDLNLLYKFQTNINYFSLAIFKDLLLIHSSTNSSLMLFFFERYFIILICSMSVKYWNNVTVNIKPYLTFLNNTNALGCGPAAITTQYKFIWLQS